MQSWEVIQSLTGHGHNVLRERPRGVVDYVIFNQGVGLAISRNQLLYRDPMPLKASPDP